MLGQKSSCSIAKRFKATYRPFFARKSMNQLNSSIASVTELGNCKVVFIITVKNPEVNKKLIYTTAEKEADLFA